jgi:hypothetical protein
VVQLQSASIGFDLRTWVLGDEGFQVSMKTDRNARILVYPFPELRLHKRPGDEGGPVARLWCSLATPFVMLSTVSRSTTIMISIITTNSSTDGRGRACPASTV